MIAELENGEAFMLGSSKGESNETQKFLKVKETHSRIKNRELSAKAESM
jgi:hypothetical protein